MILDVYLSKQINSEKRDGNTPYIVLSTLQQMKIYLPITQQNELVNFFSKFESKFKLETQKLTKLKDQQKAMQQLLLTGIVRVKK